MNKKTAGIHAAPTVQLICSRHLVCSPCTQLGLRHQGYAVARANFDLVIDPYPFPGHAESETPQQCRCEVLLHEEILAGIVRREVRRDATK